MIMFLACVSFFCVLILSILFSSNPSNLTNHILEFLKNLIKTWTVDWGMKWLVDFSAGKVQLVSFGWSNNADAIDVKMGGSVLEEKSSF